MATPQHQFGGEERFTTGQEALFAALTDFELLARVIPDLETSELVDPQTLACVVRPGFSFLRGTMKLTIRLAETHPPDSAVITTTTRGIGTTIETSSDLRLEPDSSGTLLHWTAEVTKMSGLVATVSPSLVSAAADRVIRTAWDRIRAELGEPPAHSPD